MPDIEKLLQLAKEHQWTQEEIEAHRQSFAAGNVAVDRGPDARRTIAEPPSPAEQAEELLPCPFCGETPAPDSYYADPICKWGGIQCCIEGPPVRAQYELWPAWKAAAIKAWNTRAGAPRLTPEVDRVLISYWEHIEKAHRQSAEEHAVDCSNGTDCAVYKTKMHVAGVIEVHLGEFRHVVAECVAETRKEQSS